MLLRKITLVALDCSRSELFFSPGVFDEREVLTTTVGVFLSVAQDEFAGDKPNLCL